MRFAVFRLSFCALAVVLSSCSGIGLESKKIDYKTSAATKVPTLEIPPDLTSPTRDAVSYTHLDVYKRQRLYILRQNHAPAIDESPGAGDGDECKRSPRTQTMDEHRAVARGFDQQLNVVDKGW